MDLRASWKGACVCVHLWNHRHLPIINLEKGKATAKAGSRCMCAPANLAMTMTTMKMMAKKSSNWNRPGPQPHTHRCVRFYPSQLLATSISSSSSSPSSWTMENEDFGLLLSAMMMKPLNAFNTITLNFDNTKFQHRVCLAMINDTHSLHCPSFFSVLQFDKNNNNDNKK